MNVLIIEPSKTFQLLLERIFTQYSTNIFVAESGLEASEIFQTVSIDIICLSFYLREMDGLEFVRGIRKVALGNTVPILMITTKDSQDTIASSITSGVTEVFKKDKLSDLENYLKLHAEYARRQSQLQANILIIDRDIRQVGRIREYFYRSNIQFVHFMTAEEAANLARAAEFDLVITDVVLDGCVSGLSLVREIRKINDTMYRIPILAISHLSSPLQKIELFRAGVNDYIQKPILLEELSVRLKNLLHNKKLLDVLEDRNRQLEELLNHDSLTGLYNRRHLLNIADRILYDGNRYGYPVTLLVIDLDHFKKINDRFGHFSGDSVLQAVAAILRRDFRGGDIPVRYGGEEFLVFLPHCNAEDAHKRAEKLRDKIAKLYPSGILVTASIGISQTIVGMDVSYDELFAVADNAVYQAKSKGRNCVVFLPVKVVSDSSLIN